MMDTSFFRAADLMLSFIPSVAAESCFALKGGTAINLFLRDAPRLSVDIDLTYLPIESRGDTLQHIEQALLRISDRIVKSDGKAKVIKRKVGGSKEILKLVITKQSMEIIVEPNTIFRGSVFPSQERELSLKAQQLFEQTVSITTLSVGDLYAGKLCAGLKRQHPRDLFDIQVLLENEGITPQIRKAFVVYLASHPKPMHELLDPIRRNIASLFQHEFSGMALGPVSLQSLLHTRERFMRQLQEELTDKERRFLVSLKEGEPEWTLLEIDGIEALPSLQWKLLNIKKLKHNDRGKHTIQLRKLKKVLQI